MATRFDLKTLVIGLALVSLLAPPGYTEKHPLTSPIPIPAKVTAPNTPVLKRNARSRPTSAFRRPLNRAPATAAAPANDTPTPTPSPVPRPTLEAAEPTARPTDPPPTIAPPTRLLIPAINLDAPIVAVGFVHSEIEGQPTTTWAVPDAFAVGWHHSSQAPGQIGNTVLNGHQDIHGAVLKNLAHTRPGDEIIVYASDDAYRYRIAAQHLLEDQGQPLEVRAQNAQWIMPTEDERLTLVTCAPYPHSSQRLIVVALPEVDEGRGIEDERRWTKDERWPHIHD